jgi:hypothetical protein
MLSAELARLRDTIDGWSRGEPVTADAWWQFRNNLGALVEKLALQEAGVDLALINVLIQSSRPDSNVVFLPHERAKRTDDIGSSA